MKTSYTIALASVSFEGPLELLLDLIERRKLLVNDISLQVVTDDYIAYVRNLEEHPIPEMAQFILVASTLLLIKSKSLLPVLSLTDEETSTIDDLEKRLRLYQTFRDLSQFIQQEFGKTLLFEKPFLPPSEPLFVTDKYTTVQALSQAMGTILHHLPKKTSQPIAVVQKVISLQDMMKRLEERIVSQFRFSLSEFAGDSAEKGHIIVGFLAVLELVKQGTVQVRQEERFADIHIERDSINTPKYF